MVLSIVYFPWSIDPFRTYMPASIGRFTKSFTSVELHVISSQNRPFIFSPSRPHALMPSRPRRPPPSPASTHIPSVPKLGCLVENGANPAPRPPPHLHTTGQSSSRHPSKSLGPRQATICKALPIPPPLGQFPTVGRMKVKVKHK